jgi:hypothetical protein
MTDILETDSFDAGVYQIETADDVVGGVGGVANAQALALANRTKFLKLHGLIDDTVPIGNYSIGNLFYALGARLLGKLAIGAANKVLQSTGSAPQWTDTLSLVQVTANKIIAADEAYTVTGSDTLATGIVTNIFNLPVVGLYVVSAIGGGDFSAVAFIRVGTSGTTKIIAWSTNAGNFDLDVAAGNNVTLRQAVGGSLTCKFRALRILHD